MIHYSGMPATEECAERANTFAISVRQQQFGAASGVDVLRSIGIEAFSNRVDVSRPAKHREIGTCIYLPTG